MSGIGVILNPYSKKYKKNPGKLSQLSFIIGDKASCKPTQDIDDLYRVADEFKSRNIDILAISGGDGTIHCTLTAFIRVYGEKPLPKIAFLRGGTHNIIAASLNIRGTTEELMSKLLVKYHEDLPLEEKTLRLMKINDEYGCIFGNGVASNFLEHYYHSTNLNPFNAFKTVAVCASSALLHGKLAMDLFARFDAEITVNGKKWPFANYAVVFVSTVSPLLHLDVFSRLHGQSDAFHAYGISLPPRSILPHLLAFIRGRAPNSENILDELAETITIESDKPLSYTVDGDMLPGQTSLRIEKGPLLHVVV